MITNEPLDYINKLKHSNHIEIWDQIKKDKPVSSEVSHFLLNADTLDLINIANRIRNIYNDRKTITYSRKVFINLINLCKDSCSYCTYKKEPTSIQAIMLEPHQVISIANIGKKYKCTEALIVTGERPELKYSEAKSWLTRLGYKSLVELIADLSDKILKKTGLLPHSNAGSLTKKEMSLLKSNNVSLGMMLENSTPSLVMAGKAHELAPSKNPKVRLKSITSAGELKIPITTGLLIGIGENFMEVIESLLLINDINKKYGHIQEVIIQNFTPKLGTPMEYFKSPSFEYFLRCIAVARIILKNISVQVPPNLSPLIFSEYLKAGIDDWGGISPVTPDFVNPEYPWPSVSNIKKVTNESGFTLRARLPVYPKYIVNNNLFNEFIDKDLKGYITPLVDKYGLVKEEIIRYEH